jgi:superfamily I DNA/RNA helicase
MVKIFISKEIAKKQQEIIQRGKGVDKRACHKLRQTIDDIRKYINGNLELGDPFDILKINYPDSNHGESRIHNCIKYHWAEQGNDEFGNKNHYRLVTIQNKQKGYIVLQYFGHKERDVEPWIKNNIGFRFVIDNANLGLYETYNLDNSVDKLSNNNEFFAGKLYSKLNVYWDEISAELKPKLKREFENFESIVTDLEIQETVELITDPNYAKLLSEVFTILRAGKIEQAINNIKLYLKKLKSIDDLNNEEIATINSNDQYLVLNDMDAEEMKVLMNMSAEDSMLFLHPDQRNVVNADFNSSARLLGVSGSGKTIVVVHRAIRLAEKYKKKILVLTLNPALASLIERLILKLLKQRENESLKEFIDVKSFWQLSKELILENSKVDKITRRSLEEYSVKTDETIDDIWKEYYLQLNNNFDADVLSDTHRYLLSQGVIPNVYIRQEFDLIRSFLLPTEFENYYAVDREDRKIKFSKDTDEDYQKQLNNKLPIRKAIINGLVGWNDKMKSVGIIDYAFLSHKLIEVNNGLENIPAIYKSILVDEMQDFGTLELSIIRKLVVSGENDLFFAGDMAQKVLIKHRVLKQAGISFANNYYKIDKNYRNSREILEAAYSVFTNNVGPDFLKNVEEEILNPLYANFQSHKPHLKKAYSFEEELYWATKFLKNELGNSNKKGCIAICGYSSHDVYRLRMNNASTFLKYTILSGDNYADDNIFLSDLEQTKGYEFDIMIITNANDNVIPNPLLPKEEWFREISKLYVAMTRARTNLIISYNTKLSAIFESSKSLFNTSIWSDSEKEIHFNLPIVQNEIYNLKESFKGLTAKKFLYEHPKAVGASQELQNVILGLRKKQEKLDGNIVEGVSGRDYAPTGKKIGWSDMYSLYEYFESNKHNPHLNSYFGPNCYKELRALFNLNGTKL